MILVSIIVLYAILGRSLLDSELAVDEEFDYSSYSNAIRNTFFLTSLTNFPGVLKPYVEESLFYSFYFVPFVVLTVMILLPIPIAVVFDRFRTNRTKILLEDRIREKEGLFLSFVCVDY
jgi:hypothetical protein